MARGVNKVILVGNCGQDPEVKYTASGSAVANISIATSETWKDKQTGQSQERTEWHRVVFFNRLAEIVGEYVRKGSKLYVEGSLRTRKWTDQNGQDRFTTEIVGSEMQMLDRQEQNGTEQPGGYQPQPSNSAQPSNQSQNNYGRQTPPPAGQQAHGSSNNPVRHQAEYNTQPQPHTNNSAPVQQNNSTAAPAPELDSFDDDIPF